VSWWRRTDDVVLGTATGPLLKPRIRLSAADQEHHAVIFGRTGSGKSKLLQSIFLQHLANGHGVGLIEPHHDLSFDTISSLVQQGFFEREGSFDRLVYLDWGNGDYVPFNVLRQPYDTPTTARLALDAMIRVWPELEQAPLFQTLFLSSLVALITNDLPITFLYRLLADAKFRDACLDRVTDPLIHLAFENYDKLGRDQAAAAGSTLRRAFLLSFSPVARNTLGQQDNWLNFRKIMDEGRSFIINLGNISDQESRKLIGAMLMVQIEQAALSRTDLAPAERTPCTLLVDEWPSFAAQERTIGTILSQARKYNLRLYLAAQSLSQVGGERLSGALENCRLTIAFGLGRDSAAIEARQIGSVDPFVVKEEAPTQMQHAQYLSVLEQYELWTQQLRNLSPRFAYVKLHDEEAVKVRTLNVGAARPEPERVEEVLTAYRRRYQRSAREVASTAESVSARSNRRVSHLRPAYTALFDHRDEEQSPN